MTWNLCPAPPDRPGLFEIQRIDAKGEPFDIAEIMRWDGIEFVNRFGTPVLPGDLWRDVK
ncbi:hypothetical protein [Paraburkholderia sediminicola]|uniref:hypothetical protein n=1 Tax=Paraburkholderia sediminicola TaxID=458836 RepID=UPI0038BCEFB9